MKTGVNQTDSRPLRENRRENHTSGKPWKVVANGGQLWSNGIDEHSRSWDLSESHGQSRYMTDIGHFRSTDQKVGGSNPSERTKSPGQSIVVVVAAAT